MRVILVEGPDGVGKSTFIDAMMEADGYADFLHFDRPDHRHALSQYVVDLVDHFSDDTTTLYLDRSFLGSKVWADLGFHEPTLTADQWVWLCEWYASIGAEAMFVLRSPEEIAATLTERGEDYGYAIASLNLFLHLGADVPYIPTSYWSSNLLRELHGNQRTHTE